MTFDRDCRHKIKSIGPKMLPGIHHDEEKLESSITCIITISVLFFKYNWNQDSTVSPNPNSWKISWSMVSNAADRSRSTSTEILPSSIAVCRSFVTFKVVTVPWYGRYADWKLLSSLLLFTCCNIWDSTTFSSSFEIKERVRLVL